MRRIALLAVAGLAGCQWVPGTDDHTIAKAEDLVAGQMFDPTAATFRAVRIGSGEPSGLADPLVCGEANGKNRLGAFVGFHRFIASPGEGQAMFEPEPGTADAAGFDAVWQKSCAT